MIGVAVGLAEVAPGAPLRVMPIGDSITAGYTDNPNWNVGFEFGYRAELYRQLAETGIDIQYVGESTEPWVSPFPGDPSRGGTYTPPLDLRSIGQDHHRGYGGVAAPFVIDRIGDDPGQPGWLTEDDPDVILLHIGTNGQFTSDRDRLLGLITTEKPEVQVLLAQIIPKRSYQQSIVDYNNYLRLRVLPKYEALGAKVTLVDHYTPFLTIPRDVTSIDVSLMATGNHPNQAGYRRMADTWFDALQSVLAQEPIRGDYNRDGVVDTDDYSAWSASYGLLVAPGESADGSGDGVVDAADYAVWRDAAAGSTALPEPVAGMTATLGALFTAFPVRRGR